MAGLFSNVYTLPGPQTASPIPPLSNRQISAQIPNIYYSCYYHPCLTPLSCDNAGLQVPKSILAITYSHLSVNENHPCSYFLELNRTFTEKAHMISFWTAKHFPVLQVGMITLEKALVAGLWIDLGPLNKLA